MELQKRRYYFESVGLKGWKVLMVRELKGRYCENVTREGIFYESVDVKLKRRKVLRDYGGTVS